VSNKQKKVQTVFTGVLLINNLQSKQIPDNHQEIRADENILFFLDNNTQYLVGNGYCSYTLNRRIK